ncbi:MAG TPA: lipoate--protein ligase family protein [Gemmataceae bacterium]|nr:lipoate--protein ligase family protein [Gemmataceae bacterium]
MDLLDLTLPSAAENIALDEALLLAAESGDGDEVLRFWEWPAAAVVLGSGGRIAEDVDEAACSADEVPVLRRSSGGGTVLLGRGCLLYSLVLSYERHPQLADIRGSYRYILGCIGAGLTDSVGPIEHAGISDLVCAGRKFSGTAQQRKRSFLLHHGTLLYDMDLSLIPCYLREPPRQPDYRGSRTHLAFVGNLSLHGDEIKQRLRRLWDANESRQTWPAEEVKRLVVDKYDNPHWTRRR